STELIQKGFVILYPLVVLSLLPFWMVEYRYYMIPFTLFILFAKAQTPMAAAITLILYLVADVFLINGILRGSFFM
ncbi:MAG TPA: hypothetical protein VJC17_04330, partial [Candidatus Dojkabacteria bacterium]|nr:hypothetical protein [Candidatus Dojkabacteria bacterium]